MMLGAAGGSRSQNDAATRGIRYHRRVYKRLDTYIDAEATLLVEPWFVRVDDRPRRTMRQPDAIIRYPEGTAIVVEVKLNWAPDRDEKLINEYLPLVTNAFDLIGAWPLLIVGCLRGYPHKPLLGLQQINDCLEWEPGRPTPTMLLPG